MKTKVKYIDIKEFRSEGYLQEINRQFLHPLGLALEVAIGRNGKEKLSGIWDYRDDPEGLRYAKDIPSKEHVNNITSIVNKRKPIREKALGYWIQGLEKE